MKCMLVYLVILLIALGSYEAYTNIVVSCAHEVIGTCTLNLAFKEHVCFWHIHGNNMFSVTQC